MGQAKFRGSFEERKALAEFHALESERYQNWLYRHRLEEAKNRIRGRLEIKSMIAMATGFGVHF